MSIYKDYADDVKVIKDATERNNKRKPVILGFIKNANDDSIKNDYGTFSMVDYTQYEYSTEVQELEKKLNKLKKQEREDGVAIPSVKPVLRYTDK